MTLTTSPSPSPVHTGAALFSSSSAGQPHKTSSLPAAPAEPTAAQLAADNAQKAHAGSGFALELRSKLQDVKISLSRALPEAEQLRQSRLGMEEMQRHPGPQFRQHIQTWIQSYEHLAVDMSHLHVDQATILLEELSKAKPGSIKSVDLPMGSLNVPMEKLTSALRTISERNPASSLAVSFTGRKMTAAEGKTLGQSLADTRVSALGLDAAQGHEGMSAVLPLIPGSNVRALDLKGSHVTRYESEIIDASVALDKLVLNKSLTPDKALDAAAHAQNNEAMNRIVTAFQKKVVVTDTLWDTLFSNRDLKNAGNVDLPSFKNLVSDAFSHRHAVTADFYYAAKDGTDRDRQKALVHEMSTNAGGHLQLVDLKAWDLPDMKDGFGTDIMNAMTNISRNHPQVRLTVNFLNTPFTPADAEALAETLPVAKVKLLTLDGCRIDAAGTTRIAASLKHAPGGIVDMCNNEFNSEGAQHLAAALPTLDGLFLTAANFSPVDKAKLDTVAGNHGKAISWA